MFLATHRRRRRKSSNAANRSQQRKIEKIKSDIQARKQRSAETHLENLQMLHDSVSEEIRQVFRDIFCEFDSDGNGLMVRTELGSCLATLNYNVSDDEINQLIETVTGDKEACAVDEHEWVALCAHLLKPPHSQIEIEEILHVLAKPEERIVPPRRGTLLRRLSGDKVNLDLNRHLFPEALVDCVPVSLEYFQQEFPAYDNAAFNNMIKELKALRKETSKGYEGGEAPKQKQELALTFEGMVQSYAATLLQPHAHLCKASK